MATEIKKSAELEGIIDHLTKFHNIAKAEIYKPLSMTMTEFSNARRYGSVGKKLQMITTLKQVFAEQLKDFDTPKVDTVALLEIEKQSKVVAKSERELLKEQIEFYKSENERLRKENEALLNKLLEKV